MTPLEEALHHLQAAATEAECVAAALRDLTDGDPLTDGEHSRLRAAIHALGAAYGTVTAQAILVPGEFESAQRSFWEFLNDTERSAR